MYADDIAFNVFNKTKTFTPEQAFNFFLDWINAKPVNTKGEKAKWLNVGIMLNNCFAISNLTRHNIKDIGNQAENKVQLFLSQTNELMSKEFPYFKNFMTNLKQDPTREEFEQDLTEYLNRTIKLARQRI